MIYTVTLNPALDKTMEIPSFTTDAVNRVTGMRTDPGGKGINVSKVIQKLGGKSIAAGILAGNTGHLICNAVEDMGIATMFLFADGETRTNTKIVDPVLHTNTDINEPGAPVEAELADRLLLQLTDRATDGDIVVLSGSLPEGLRPDTYAVWTKALNASGAKVFLDADGVRLAAGLTASPCLVKPNERELAELAGRGLSGTEQLEAAAREVLEQYGVKEVVVSMGSEGALYVTEEETIYAEGLSVPVGSTVGAGDSVVAALAVAEENGNSPEEAVRLSTAAGAANVMCSGSQPAEYDTVKELLPKVVLHRIRG